MLLSDMLTQMLAGSLVTMKLFFITLLLSMPLGLCITFLYISNNKIVKSIAGFYILIMRGTPLLMQMLFVYFGLPRIPYVGKYLIFGRFTACAIAFVLNYAAYFAEFFRGGLLAIDQGQFEAAKVLGMTPVQTARKVVLPQVIRVVLPAVSNEAIVLVKDTALVTILAQPDLLHITNTIVSNSASITPFFVAAIFYLVMSYILTVFFRSLEKKFSFE